jgi:hypothetical protein
VVMCRGLITTQRLTSKLISGPSPTAKTRLVSFNRTVRNTLKTHLYLTGQISSSYVAVEQRKKPQPTFCVSAKLWLHTCVYLGSFFFNPEDVKSLNLGAIWNFNKGTGLPWLGTRLCGTRGPSKGIDASGLKGLEPIH